MLELHYPTVTKTILERQYPGKPTLKVAFGNDNGAIFENSSKLRASPFVTSRWPRSSGQTNYQVHHPPLVLINWQLSKQGTRWPVSLDGIAGSGVDPSRSSFFLKLSADKVLVFKWSQAQVHFFFLIHMKYVVFMCCTIKILIANWPRTWKFSQLLQAGKTVAFVFSHNGHALVTLYVQFLCSDWSKFDRWVHAQNLCSILNLVYFNSWSWQSFVSTCDVFNCLFPLDVQNEIQLLSGVFCYSWLVCLLGFWLRKRRLSKSEIRFRMASIRFRFSPCLLKSLKRCSFQELPE